MDRSEQDMTFVGFFGIFNHSFKSIFSRKKIFTQITLAFILPLAIIYIIQFEITHHFISSIENNTLPYDTNDSRKAIGKDWLYNMLFTIAWFIFLIFFSLPCTAAVVFTVASIYTSREVVFRDFIKVIRKVWKRLWISLVLIYILQFVYDAIGSVAMAIPWAIFGNSGVGVIIMIIILILYVYGFFYLSVVCQLASVVTVLQNVHGCKALKRGKDLVKGKKRLGMGMMFVLYGFLKCLSVVYLLFVDYGHEVFKLALIWRVVIGISCGILGLMWLLLFFVSETVLYLVCKSYHGEAIDKLGLSMFLGAYIGETVADPETPTSDARNIDLNDDNILDDEEEDLELQRPRGRRSCGKEKQTGSSSVGADLKVEFDEMNRRL